MMIEDKKCVWCGEYVNRDDDGKVSQLETL